MGEDNKPLFGIPSKKEVDVGECVLTFFIKGRKRPYKRIVQGQTWLGSQQGAEAYAKELIYYWGAKRMYEVEHNVFVTPEQIIKITIGKTKSYKIWVEMVDLQDAKVNNNMVVSAPTPTLP